MTRNYVPRVHTSTDYVLQCKRTDNILEFESPSNLEQQDQVLDQSKSGPYPRAPEPYHPVFQPPQPSRKPWQGIHNSERLLEYRHIQYSSFRTRASSYCRKMISLVSN